MDNLPIEHVSEAPHDPGLGVDIPEHPQMPGTEDWRDGVGDDGEAPQSRELAEPRKPFNALGITWIADDFDSIDADTAVLFGTAG